LTALSKNIFTLFQKEFSIEFRKRSTINGIVLYLISTIFICYLSFNLRGQRLDAVTWNTLFWIITLFTAINAIAKSFMQESESRFLYYYIIASPEAIIISKIAYNVFLMTLLSFLALFFYSVVLGNEVADLGLFSLNLLLGALGFSSTLTMVSSIASKAGNSTVLMAILSFPVILPMLLLLIRVSKNAIDGLDWSVSTNYIITLLAINMIVVTISWILFPYVWRS
jgi:heme exporter protein B